MRVLITGSREWADTAAVRTALDVLLAEYAGLLVVHGACPRGADAIADRWACDQQAAGGNVLIGRYPAN